MTLQTETPPPAEEPASPAESEGTQQPPQTVEEVEKAWEYRVSQKDRAHAAAERALRDENDALKRQMEALSKPRPQSSGQSGAQTDAEADALREQLDAQRKELEDERRRNTLEQRRAKYPALAKNVGEAGIDIFTVQDEATLARLNAQLDDGSSGTGTFAPTSPRRTPPAATKSLGEMNKAELEDQLRRSVERGDLKREQR